MGYYSDRLARLSDDEIWALDVRESYNAQLESGVREPRLSEWDRWVMPGGDCLEELGKLGLKTALYEDGVYIEPESKHPSRPGEILYGEEGASNG